MDLDYIVFDQNLSLKGGKLMSFSSFRKEMKTKKTKYRSMERINFEIFEYIENKLSQSMSSKSLIKRLIYGF